VNLGGRAEVPRQHATGPHLLNKFHCYGINIIGFRLCRQNVLKHRRTTGPGAAACEPLADSDSIPDKAKLKPPDSADSATALW
jgi:hypothetical protein